MIDHRAFKDAINSEFARIAKALANPHRFEIVDLLAQGERSVEDLANETGLTLANASQHMQALREAHLVASRKEGLRVYYRLADPTIFRLVQVVREIAQHQLAEVDRIVDSYLHNRETLQAITTQELQSLISQGNVVILDVRPITEYEQGHIAGALSIPIEELDERLSEISPSHEVVAYCRGPYCVFADEAAELLAAKGYSVRQLREGYPDWELAGLPIERAQGA
jgi:rhodanese-related sulfurtransferase/DNA-binding transcriptional ArsR family regulator